MLMLVNCSNCHTPLQLPSGAIIIRCAVCCAITRIAGAPSYLSTTSSFSNNGYHPPPLPPPYLPTTYSSERNYNCYYPPAPSGRKKAVIVGILYRGMEDELHGCINDAKNMKRMLINSFNFPESSILLLTDEETDLYRTPTKHNIKMAMLWLVQGCQAGDSLVFHYSGHGGQQENNTGDEIDGFDETLCPLDTITQGVIIDNEINAAIVRPLPAGVKLHAIIDSCHSGTLLDLPFLCRMDRSGRYAWEDHRPPSGAWKGTSGGEAILFSGCDDHQLSMDITVPSKMTCTGAMTSAFIQAIENGERATYGSILNAMRSTVKTLPTAERQEPQLSCDQQFDIYLKPFSL